MSSIAICHICEHIKDDGIRCGTPALRGRHFCFYHQRLHSRRGISPRHSCRVIPPLKSARDIRVCAANILRDLRDGRIDLHTARAMSYALQVANNTLRAAARLDDLHHALQ